MYSVVEIKAGKIRIGKNKIKRTKQEKRRIIEVKKSNGKVEDLE